MARSSSPRPRICSGSCKHHPLKASRLTTTLCGSLSTTMSGKLDLLQGTLDLLILRTLQWGPQHGHGIGQAIRAKSDDLLQVEHGSLYPALHRLRREGWIESEWGITDNNQRAKFYRLTAAGKRQLAAEESRWKLFVKTMGRVLRSQE